MGENWIHTTEQRAISQIQHLCAFLQLVSQLYHLRAVRTPEKLRKKKEKKKEEEEKEEEKKEHYSPQTERT